MKSLSWVYLSLSIYLIASLHGEVESFLLNIPLSESSCTSLTKLQVGKYEASAFTEEPNKSQILLHETVKRDRFTSQIKKFMIPVGVGIFTVFSCFFPSITFPTSFSDGEIVKQQLASSQVNAAETVAKQVSKFKVKETVNGVKFFEVQKGSGESPHDGDLIIINYIGYLSDGTIFDSQHAPGKKPLAFQFGKNQVIPGLEDALKTMQPGGERQVLVPPSMGYGDRGVCLDKDDVNKEKCLIPPGSNLKYQLQLKRVAVSPI